jgi:hypothetical protein
MTGDAVLNELMVWAAILFNVVISLGYGGIGVYVAPKFDAAAPSVGLKLTKASALVFFITCAMTHVELATHIYTDRPAWMLTPHFIVVHGLQAAAAPTFLFLASAYMSIRIFNRQLYQGLLERRIVEVRDEVLRQQEADAERMKDERIDRALADGDAVSRSVWGALGRSG